MTLLTNSFEGGTSGTTLTTGNTGGASGNAFDLITIGTGATNAFDNAHAANGTLSCQIATGGTAAQARCEWSTSMGTQSQAWYRQYLYFTANPANQHRVFEFLSGGSNAAGVILTTSGHLQALNGAGSAIFTSTASIPLSQWFRIEGFVTGSATVGQIELKLFNTAGSATANETDTSAANLNTTGAMTRYMFGTAIAVASTGPYWMDDLGLSSTGYIGPAGTLPRPVILGQAVMAAAAAY